MKSYCARWLVIRQSLSHRYVPKGSPCSGQSPIHSGDMGVVGSPSLHFSGRRSELPWQRVIDSRRSSLVRTILVSDSIFGATIVDKSPACYVGADSCFWKKLGIMLPTSFRMWYTEQDSGVSTTDSVKRTKCCECLLRIVRSEHVLKKTVSLITVNFD